MWGGSSSSTPLHEAAGRGRRAMAWTPGNPGAVAALLNTHSDLRSKSRDLVRRNAWANAALDAFVANAVGTGIKPQSLCPDDAFRKEVQALWRDWTEEADAAGQTDFYGLQALACRAMLEAGECLIRLRPRRLEDGLSVPLQIQLLESEHLPITLNQDLGNGNVIRAGIEFDALGRRVAYHLYRAHPEDGRLAPMSGSGAGQNSGNGIDTVRVPATEVLHLYRVLRPGQIRGEPWLSRALVKLHELDQYDDAELVRKKTAAMFAGFVTRQHPEDNLMGEGAPDAAGVALSGLEPGTLQILEPGEDIKFSDPADVGGSYGEFLRTQFRAVAAAMGITYEQLTGDLTGVNYSSIRAGLLEFRRRCEMIQHSVLVHQLCRPVWAAWLKQAVLAGSITASGYMKGDPASRRHYGQAKWIPQGWQWVDPEKEFKAMLLAIRAGLMSRSEAIAAFGYDAEDIDREIAADNQRADELGLIFDSDARQTSRVGNHQSQGQGAADAAATNAASDRTSATDTPSSSTHP
ncbi:phage portal protein [Ottowia testudinis]|uniref:Phage portal protein n=1 Tax=Ottowia testudinis TaxID=2816950 RepID=A0A975H5G2_9BURK|nr:phage portal protein [Ottowia testudinis]QTD47415.1 phage portal protein [Ottowia testudinis]